MLWHNVKSLSTLRRKDVQETTLGTFKLIFILRNGVCMKKETKKHEVWRSSEGYLADGARTEKLARTDSQQERAPVRSDQQFGEGGVSRQSPSGRSRQQVFQILRNVGGEEEVGCNLRGICHPQSLRKQRMLIPESTNIKISNHFSTHIHTGVGSCGGRGNSGSKERLWNCNLTQARGHPTTPQVWHRQPKQQWFRNLSTFLLAHTFSLY